MKKKITQITFGDLSNNAQEALGDDCQSSWIDAEICKDYEVNGRHLVTLRAKKKSHWGGFVRDAVSPMHVHEDDDFDEVVKKLSYNIIVAYMEDGGDHKWAHMMNDEGVVLLG